MYIYYSLYITKRQYMFTLMILFTCMRGDLHTFHTRLRYMINKERVGKSKSRMPWKCLKVCLWNNKHDKICMTLWHPTNETIGRNFFLICYRLATFLESFGILWFVSVFKEFMLLQFYLHKLAHSINLIRYNKFEIPHLYIILYITVFWSTCLQE